MKRRWLCPEVVQTSAMDCGPASLTCLLEGFGVSVSYGRLREACQTDVDGTSIDTLEEVARRLGLDAEQVMVPADHVLLDEAQALPAIAVVRLPNGFTHFVVIWRRHGGWVQVMDPASGRRWMRAAALTRELYRHQMAVPAAGWREWAGSDDALRPLRRRLATLGVRETDALVAGALADPSWRGLAALDAATRLTDKLVRAGGVQRGSEAARVLAERCARAGRANGDAAIPAPYWSVHAAQPDDDGGEQLALSGAVLVRVRGVLTAPLPDALPPALTAALAEPPARPGLALWKLLREDGVLTPLAIGLALLVAAGGGVAEAVLFRGLFGIGRHLGLWHQRFAAFVGLGVFLFALVLLELPILALAAGMGRRLEARLRIAFLTKIPRLGDRYFRSRPASDMAERSHSLHLLRQLPQLGNQLLSSVLQLCVTTIGLAWLDPRGAKVAIIAGVLGVALPLAVQSPLAERDLRVRVHDGSLLHFYLDALLGLVAVRSHGAERALRREHEGLLVEWARASRALLRTALWVEAAQALIGFGLVAWLLSHDLARGGEVGGALLVVYWALSLPVLGQEVAVAARQYPAIRNLTLRLLEPLGAPDEDAALTPIAPAPRGTAGVALSLDGVSVLAGGHTILDGVDLQIAAGSQVAIVGPSGAGKSSLVGLLLGWHRPSTGTLTVDGVRLDGAQLTALRRETAWVDPAVQLWNASLLDNLAYGGPDGGRGGTTPALSDVIDAAELRSVLEQLPEGLQTTLGESGARVSGGEGQRVRFGRALGRRDARLVILDEPFRGLDRAQRKLLLARARRFWPRATLLCITHDVGETRDFPRVLVIEGGRIVEDAAPVELVARSSRYRALLDAETALRSAAWSSATWRRLCLRDGRVTESTAEDAVARDGERAENHGTKRDERAAE